MTRGVAERLTVARLTGDCALHRPALLALLEDPMGVDLTDAERAHLDRCDACRQDLAGIVLTGVAVRRAFAEPAAIGPSSEAWPRLRSRLARRRHASPGRAASPVLAVALAGGLAAALLIPLGAPIAAPPVMHETGIDPAAVSAAGQRDAEGEARQLRAIVRAGKAAAAGGGTSWARVQLIRYEVTPTPVRRAPARPAYGTSAR